MKQKFNTFFGNQTVEAWLVIIGFILLVLGFLFSIQPHFFRFDDNVHFHLPANIQNWRVLTESKRLALVNFYQFNGNVHLSQGQTSVLYPINYVIAAVLVIIFGNLSYLLEAIALVHLLIGTVGNYSLTRQLGVSPKIAVASSLIGVSFPFWLGVSRSWILLLYLYAWAPWIMCATNRYKQKQSVYSLILQLISRVLLVYAGYIQWYVLFVTVEVIWEILDSRWSIRLLSRLKRWVGWQLWTIGLTAPLLLSLYANTSRSLARTSHQTLIEFIQHRVTLITALKSQIGLFVENQPFTNPSYILYIGVPVILVIIWGFRGVTTKREVYHRLLILLIISLAFSSVGYVIFYWVPVLQKFRWPFKYYSLVVLIITWLLGMSLEALKKNGKSKIVIGLVSFSLFTNLSIIWLYRGSNGAFSSQWMIDTTAPEWVNRIDTQYRVKTVGVGNGYGDQTSSFMRFNYPTIAELMSSNGYDATVSQLHERLLINERVRGFAGGIDDNMLDYWQDWGVKYLVVDNTYDYLDLLKARQGLKTVYQDDTVWVISLSGTKPIVSTADLDESLPWYFKGNQVITSVNSTANTSIVFRFAPMPGYQVFVDDRKSLWTTTQDNQIQVTVPSGSHQVRLVYRDIWFEWGVIVMVSTCVGLGYFLHRQLKTHQ